MWSQWNVIRVVNWCTQNIPHIFSSSANHLQKSVLQKAIISTVSFLVKCYSYSVNLSESDSISEKLFGTDTMGVPKCHPAKKTQKEIFSPMEHQNPVQNSMEQRAIWELKADLLNKTELPPSSPVQRCSWQFSNRLCSFHTYLLQKFLAFIWEFTSFTWSVLKTNSQ